MPPTTPGTPQGGQTPPTGANVPTAAPMAPVVPIVGANTVAGQAMAAKVRQSAAEKRQATLQKIAGQSNPIFRRAYYKSLQKGSLANFNYTFWKHDPYPLMLCSGIYQDGRVAGVNLHYMTFKYIRYLIQQYCGKAFSYPLIKNNIFIYNSFRSYKRDGMRMVKLLDCEFLMTLLGTVRSFNPNEVKAIREEVQRQLKARMHPTHEDATNEYEGMVVPNPNHKQNLDTAGYNSLERYGEPHWPNAVPKLINPKPTLGDARFNPTGLDPL